MSDCGDWVLAHDAPEQPKAPIPTIIDEAWLRSVLPGKPIEKIQSWVAVLLTNEFSTAADLQLLDAEGWAALPLPLAVSLALRRAIEAEQPAGGPTPEALTPPTIGPVPPPRPITQIDIVVIDISASMRGLSCLDPHESEEYRPGMQSTRCTREDISKKLFHTLIDKTLVFELSHAVGLLSFGEGIHPVAITRDYEKFHDELGRLDACQGRTRLYDSIRAAADMIDTYAATQEQAVPSTEGHGRLAKRIFVLTDGADNASVLAPWQLAQHLQARSITLDAIPLAGANATLATLCAATPQGLCFDCHDQEQGIGLFEREATLCLAEREQAAAPPPSITGPDAFAGLQASVRAAPPTTTIRSAVPNAVYAPVLSVQSAVAKAHSSGGSGGGGAAGALRRALKEYAALATAPPEGWRIFVSADNPLMWKAVLERGEPTEEWLRQVGRCPYAGGTWLLSINLPTNYPFAAPSIRFVTPVYHCNVSQDGMICLEMLQDGWSPALSLKRALEGVRALLLAPDALHPLDAWKGSLYRDNPAMYLDEATKHTREHASEGWDVLREKYQLQQQEEGTPASQPASPA